MLTIRAGGSSIVANWLTCRPGEASEDGQRWWDGHHGDPKLFATFTALIDMKGDWMRNVRDPQRLERAYLLEGPKAAGRPRKTADIPFADCDANQLTKEELVQSLNACATQWKHDWQTQPRLPIKYEKDKFDELFQETGIAVLQFERGDELKMLQEEATDRATRLPKITIHNGTEVIESVPTANEMGGVTHPWTTVAIGCARMQSYLPKGGSMPGTAFIENTSHTRRFQQRRRERCE